MNDDFLLVHKSILPKYYELVLKAKEKIEGENQSVSEVCKTLGISRSTYYKYKDVVFYPSNNTSKKAVLLFKVVDEPGILSQIITTISLTKCNVLTISQNMPIHDLAIIMVMLDYGDCSISLKELIESLKKIKGIKSVEVTSYE